MLAEATLNLPQKRTRDRDQLSQSHRPSCRLHSWAFLFVLFMILNPLPTMLTADTIASFEDPAFLEDWAVVNDTVMGGVSRSRIEQTGEGNLRFTGDLSLRNNGGFVSMRNRPSRLSLEDADGLALRVRGDGRTYYLDLRPGGQRMGGSFRAPFKTVEGEWTEVVIPLTDFFAQSFGRVISNAVLDPSSITSIGFTLSDKQPGAFSLEVESVKRVVDDSFQNAQATLTNPANQARVLIELAISKGVPLFNEGNEAGCAAVYEVACVALLTMPGVSNTSINRLSRALNELVATSSDAQRAWILRYALDDTYRDLGAGDELGSTQ